MKFVKFLSSEAIEGMTRTEALLYIGCLIDEIKSGYTVNEEIDIEVNLDVDSQEIQQEGP